MKKAALYSALLHIGILILLTVGFYNPFRKPLAEQTPIMIEFVNIAEISTAPVLAPEDVRDPEPTPELEAEENPAPQAVEPEPKTEVKPEVKPEVQPETTKPEVIPEQKPTPEPEPTPAPIEKKEPKKEEPKPEPKPPLKKEEVQEKPKKDDKPKPEKVEVNLDKKEDKPKPKEIDKKEKKKIDDDFASLIDDATPKKPSKDKQKTDGRIKGAPADKIGDTVTANEISALNAHMRRCWIIPNGVRGAKNMSVIIDMKVSKEGVVQDAKIRDTHRLSTDPIFRAAAESARRAVLDPSCNPLPLPADKYDQWKELDFDFDPQKMY